MYLGALRSSLGETSLYGDNMRRHLKRNLPENVE